MNLLNRTSRLFVIVALGLTAGCAGVPPSEEPPAETRPAMDSLVSAEWLMDHLDDPDLVVLDATVLVESDEAGNFQTVSGRASYEGGHIPGAVSIPDRKFDDMKGDLPQDKNTLLVFYCGGYT